MKILDTKRPFVYLGPKDDLGYLWAQQDGVLFNWSDSNVRYEEAWWVDRQGFPIDDGSPAQEGPGKMLRVLAQSRPFDQSWWNDPIPVSPEIAA